MNCNLDRKYRLYNKAIKYKGRVFKTRRELAEFAKVNMETITEWIANKVDSDNYMVRVVDVDREDE